MQPFCGGGAGSRTKAGRGRRHGRTAGGCEGAENLNIPAVFQAGTGAIRQECLMHSRLSAPQNPDGWSGFCPARNAAGTLRFSRVPTDARRSPMPPSPVCFLGDGCGRVAWGGCGSVWRLRTYALNSGFSLNDRSLLKKRIGHSVVSILSAFFFPRSADTLYTTFRPQHCLYFLPLPQGHGSLG